jgi:DNA-binding transcriptional MerR regulator
MCLEDHRLPPKLRPDGGIGNDQPRSVYRCWALASIRATRTKLTLNIARGLLNGTANSSRVAEYTAERVVRLEQIKRLQADGHKLLEIGRILRGPSATKSGIEPPTAWWQHAIADDVIVWVRDGASPWRTKQLRGAVEEFAHRVRPEKRAKG